MFILKIIHILKILLQTCCGSFTASARGNEKITVNELADYVSREVPRLTLERFGYEQFPMQDVRGQSFPLTVVGE